MSQFDISKDSRLRSRRLIQKQGRQKEPTLPTGTIMMIAGFWTVYTGQATIAWRKGLPWRQVVCAYGPIYGWEERAQESLTEACLTVGHL